MAFKKNRAYGGGKFGNIIGDYWRITEAVFDILTDEIYVTLSLYYNEQARIDNKDPMSQERLTLSGAGLNLNQPPANLLASMYTRVKAEYPEWADAVDV